ncbi:hypothetical protein TSUD_37000 [Trifolium subterraneum]|uniref:DOG1 domain-containing protein n=1 Tax=Trifolium subterraneum TaxID=3900 RepID=A0A2Z6LM57_TRISU|nr:hypothetical protein TSUD_37000 [Trifolium subterraneum]
MSFNSNKLNQSSKLLEKKSMSETNDQGQVLKINGNTISMKNYALSSEEQNKLICEIQSVLKDQNHMKTRSANVDVFNVSSATTCERNLWWIGGFRPSQLLQVILPQVQHMCSKQQLSDVYDLGQSCQVAEYALAQGLVKLQQNIDKATPTDDKEFLLSYVHQQLCFFKQADNLRQEFLHQFSRLLTITQQAEFIVALKEHLHNPQPRRSSL